MTTMIEVENLGKSYRIGSKKLPYATLRDKIAGLMTHPFRRGQAADTQLFWALKDVSFKVAEGEVVGVIGRNGAGKSTLLKILSRITRPTEGWAKLRGRVGSLLEVGTGFHPELTGRENIYLSGTILGMRRAEVKKNFDAIVDFAEVEQFLDTPVKHYSSGMYVRLGFAIAAHLNPEILLVDEVLAVGDMQFQKKCLGKMGEVAKAGRTVLFVSHNMAAVRSLCPRCALFDKGKMTLLESTDTVLDTYERMAVQYTGFREWPKNDAPGTYDIRLLSISTYNSEENISGHFDMEDAIIIKVVYRISSALPAMRMVLRISTPDGIIVFLARDNESALWRDCRREKGTYSSNMTIHGGLFNTGTYLISVSAEQPPAPYHFLEENILCFNVTNAGTRAAQINEPWPGVICPRVDWNISYLGK